MRLVGMMLSRNEQWCLGLSLRVALRWCDAVVVLNHASTDRTPEILAEVRAEVGDRLHVLEDRGEVWTEMQHRQQMLDEARRMGATHCAIIDADEILTANLVPAIRSIVKESCGMLSLPGYNLRGGIDKFHANGIWANRWFTTAFRDRPALHWTGDTFHQREPLGSPMVFERPVHHGNAGTMHLWGANERRLRAKHALYKATERVRWPHKPIEEIDRMYSLSVLGTMAVPASQWVYADVPAAWWDGHADLMRHLDVDAEPWQEAETRRLVEAHGPEYFRGLDLFGVTEAACTAH